MNLLSRWLFGIVLSCVILAGQTALAKTLVDTDSAQGLSNKSVTATGGSTARMLETRFADVANVMDYGATGNGSTDDTAAFQAAAAAKLTVYIPEAAVNYKLTGTVLLRAYAYVFGDGYRSSVQWTGGDIPVFAQQNYASVNSAGSDFVTLYNFRIDDNAATRVTHWTIELTNAINNVLSRMRIEGPAGAANTDLYGVRMGLAPGSSFSGNRWLSHIYDCRFSSSKIYIDAGDGFILRNLLYGYLRDYAVRVGGNTVISDNEIGGGQVQGGVYIEAGDLATVSSVHITNNHFDGNATQNTAYGIYASASQLVRNGMITGNTGFNQNKEFVHLGNSLSTVIANNEMRDMDADDTGEDDIYVSGYANVIGPNGHLRSATAPKAGARVNLAVPVHVIQATGTDLNIVIPGTVTANYLSRSFVNYDALGRASKEVLFDEFMGLTVDTNKWVTFVGSDPQCVAANLPATAGGSLQMTFGDDAGATMALNGSQLSGGLNWITSHNSSGFTFETIVKVENGHCKFGLQAQIDVMEIDKECACNCFKGHIHKLFATAIPFTKIETPFEDVNIW